MSVDMKPASTRMLMRAAWLHSYWQNLTYEIILTLGQAFEVAYQLALQAQRTKQHQGAQAGPGSEVIETKSSRPVPKPRPSMRKSGVSLSLPVHTACVCHFLYTQPLPKSIPREHPDVDDMQ